MLRFRKLAQRAWIRHRLPRLADHHDARSGLEVELRSLEQQLSRLSHDVEPEEEARFQRAALDKAIELHGECSRVAQEHAARLSELDTARRPEGILSEAVGQLSLSSHSMGLMSYAEGFLYVFRRTVGGLQITASPVDEARAYELLEQLSIDDTVLGRMDTATRVDACRPEVVPSGERLRIEVDHEGFWVSVECRSGLRMTFKNAFPRFEEAKHYVRGSLREDLLAGLSLTTDWQRSDESELATLEAMTAELPTAAEKSSLGRTLWSMLTAVPGYRSVFEEGISDKSESKETLPS